MSKRACIPLAQGCEELEAVTIMDLLVRAKIEVVPVSLDECLEIVCSRGTRLIAEKTLSEVMDEMFDLVVLPGGLPGSDYLNDDERIHQLLNQTHQEGRLVGAICAAPKVLVKAGLLNNKHATSYPGVIDQTPAQGMTYSNDAVVEDERVITSRGPGTAMDFALYLIERLQGSEVRQQVETSLVR